MIWLCAAYAHLEGTVKALAANENEQQVGMKKGQ